MVGKCGWGSAVYSGSGSIESISAPCFAGAEVRGAAWQIGFAEPLLAFSVHAPSRGESYANRVDKLLDAIRRIARDRELVLGGDFNLTISWGTGRDRPTTKRDRAIQSRLTEELLAGSEPDGGVAPDAPLDREQSDPVPLRRTFRAELVERSIAILHSPYLRRLEFARRPQPGRGQHFAHRTRVLGLKNRTFRVRILAGDR